MAKCPNRNRKRVAPGGGYPGCQGKVELVLQVPVTLTCKRLPRGADGFQQLVTSQVQRYGVRVQPETIRRAVNNYKYDVCCNECGWSLNKAQAAAVKKKKK